jgi:hypothetical protein
VRLLLHVRNGGSVLAEPAAGKCHQRSPTLPPAGSASTCGGHVGAPLPPRDGIREPLRLLSRPNGPHPHEARHIKLSALLNLVSLCKPDDGQRYYAPWRVDPRPASGLLQGAYAFLGVSGFWRGQQASAPEPEVRRRAAAEFALWGDGAALVCDTLLSSEQLTPEGLEFTREMERVPAAWQREPVSAVALAVARTKACGVDG